MDDFTKYQEMRGQGATPRQLYETAQADGVDGIARIRLLRKVCGLSLAEAKQVSGASDVLNSKQEVKIGATLYWEGWAIEEGPYLRQGQVMRLEGDRVVLQGLKKYRITADGLEEVPLEGNGSFSLPVAYFDKTLAERLGDAVAFVQQLTQINRAGT